MADPKVRAAGDCTLGESCFHIACAGLVLVVVYLIAGLVGDGAVAATRYFSG